MSAQELEVNKEEHENIIPEEDGSKEYETFVLKPHDIKMIWETSRPKNAFIQFLGMNISPFSISNMCL